MYELFMDIPDYEGLYQVSNLGNIRSLERAIVYKDSRTHVYPGQIIKQRKDKDGYMLVSLNKDGKRETYRVHRLVLSAFKANPDNKPHVNHIDEDKTNNSLNNLEWSTAKENCNHGTRTARSANGHCKKIRCIETGVIYNSVKDAALAVNLKASNHISESCKRGNKTAGGYHWEYV